MITDTTVSNPAPTALAMTTVPTAAGTVAIICEPINEWLAITPVFGMSPDGKTWLTGTFTITHRTTGFNLAEGGGCINCCRNAGQEMVKLPMDWSALNAANGAEWVAALDEQTSFAFGTARAVAWRCDADYCDEIPNAAPITPDTERTTP